MTTATNGAGRAARTIAALAASAMLAACGANSQSASTIPQQPMANAQATRLGHAGSWMDPAAKSQKLVYVSDFLSADVDVYTYPYLRLAGVLTGFKFLRGMCTDPSGYVWIVDNAEGAVFEYAHGGTTPVNTLTATAPNGCATNPKNGDLAVSDGASGQIEIFHNAAGYGTVVADSNFTATMYLGYDKAGNLFVDGYNPYPTFHYAELPAGGSSFTDITLSQTPQAPGNVQWDGTYMAVGDTGSTIYQTQGSTVVSSTTLGFGCVDQFYIVPSKRKVIAPDLCNATVGIVAYPGGGAALKTISGGLQSPVGTVLSL